MMRESYNVREEELLGGRLLTAAMNTPDTVSVEGSVYGGPNLFPRGKRAIPTLAAELLDAGTAKKRKRAIREGLALRAAQLSFGSAGDRTLFSGTCFPEDLPYLLAVVAESLTGAIFPATELSLAKARERGHIREERSDTRAQAERALANLIYDDAHANYAGTFDEEVACVARARRQDLVAFRNRLGAGGLVLAIAGDIENANARETALRAFAKLKKGTRAPTTKERNRKLQSGDARVIPLADKANVDVMLGAGLGITGTDPLFHSALVLAHMLGGGVTSHLMQTIRERDGLSYGVYARLAGFADGADGYFKVWATFSPERYAESLGKLRAEIREFFANGITEDALAKKREEIPGAYLVSLSTSRGLASALHRLAADGKELEYLYAFPDVIRRVSLADLNRAADLVPLSRLSLAASGTFPKK